MVKVVVEPDICSEQTIIAVDKANKRKVKVTIGSGCETVIKLGKPLTEVDQWGAVRQHSDCQVLEAASRCQVHVTCSFTTAIIKAIKVEGNHILPLDVLPRFELVKL